MATTSIKQKIKSFNDLLVWQKGHLLVIDIYKTTKTFPREELYSLGDQIRRAAVSVTSNIAEGFGRAGYKEKTQFYYLAKGSLTEIKNQLFISRDVGYISYKKFENLMDKSNEVDKLLQGLIKSTKKYYA